MITNLEARINPAPINHYKAAVFSLFLRHKRFWLVEKWHKYCSIFQVLLVTRIASPSLEAAAFEHGNATDLGEEEGREERSQHGHVFTSLQHMTT